MLFWDGTLICYVLEIKTPSYLRVVRYLYPFNLEADLELPVIFTKAYKTLKYFFVKRNLIPM